MKIFLSNSADNSMNEIETDAIDVVTDKFVISLRKSGVAIKRKTQEGLTLIEDMNLDLT